MGIVRWLDAHCDRNVHLTTLPRAQVLSDCSGDGDYRLVLADINLDKNARSRLKVYKGPVICSDQALPGIPSGVISFYPDQFEPRIPAIGVSCGSDLLLYKNNKPYFKYTVPCLPLNPLEVNIWKNIAEEKIGDLKTGVIEELKSVAFNELSARSQKLLSLPEKDWLEFIKTHKSTELVKMVPITCMTTINKNSMEQGSISCPILAVECGIVYILDPQTFTIIHEASISTKKSSPAFMECTGTFDADYRLIIACREGHVCLLRRAWLEGKVLFQTTSDIVDMVLTSGDNFIVIATFDSNLTCYTKKGSKLWSLAMKQSITCLCLIPLHHISTSLVAVGMRGGCIQLYQGRQPVDQLLAPDTPSTINFGHMGQEDHVLVVTTMKGAIDFKILKRTADFNLSHQDSSLSPTISAKPLPLPKRSKLFLEQTQRERQNAVEMHEHYQQDLIRIRLVAARATVSQTDQSALGNDNELIKIAAQVLGLGPRFSLILTLENMSPERAISGLILIFHTNGVVYQLSRNLIHIPLIPPNLSYKLETKVEESLDVTIDPATSKVIRVFVVRSGQAQPLLAATINMPPTDLSALIL